MAPFVGPATVDPTATDIGDAIQKMVDEFTSARSRNFLL